MEAVGRERVLPAKGERVRIWKFACEYCGNQPSETRNPVTLSRLRPDSWLFTPPKPFSAGK